MTTRTKLGLAVAAAVLLALVLWPEGAEEATPTPGVERRSGPRPGPVPVRVDEAESDEVEEVVIEVEEDEEPPKLRCPVTMDAPFDGEVVFVEILPLDGGGIQPTRVPARLEGGQLIAEVTDASHGGWVEIPGHPDVDWEPGDDGCMPVTLESVSGVVGTVSPAEGDVRVRACGTSEDVDEDGSFYVPAQPGPCRVEASRSDGVVIVDGESIEVEVPEGGDVVVDLWVPEDTWGSVGLWLDQVEPVHIRSVVPDSPAEEAGLEAGMRVLSIDGASPAGCDRGWLLSCLHGPEGSVVELELEGLGIVEIERGWIEAL